MLVEQILGWAANTCVVVGALLLWRKNISGFWAHLAGCALYGVQALLMYNWSLVALEVFLVVMNAVTWKIWYDERKK